MNHPHRASHFTFRFQGKPFGSAVRITAVLAILIVFVLFLPPERWYIIALFNAGLGILAFFFVELFLSKRLAIVTGIFVFLILLLVSFSLFDPINIALLISLLIGSIILIQ